MRASLFTLQDYYYATSVEDAYHALLQSKHNVILGGLLWLKMNKKAYQTGIDLSGIGLNQIVEHETTIEIGTSTTLRQMEKSPLLQTYCNGMLPKAIKQIVGVQFRNLATIGGSVYSRFGFSDVITALLALDCQVELHKNGILPLEEFIQQAPMKKDILVKIIIKKDQKQGIYFSQRLSATDLPILNLAMSVDERGWRIAIGSRPHRAQLAIKTANLLSETPTPEEVDKAVEQLTHELTFGTNIRGSATYRETLAKVFVKRGVQALCN